MALYNPADQATYYDYDKLGRPVEIRPEASLNEAETALDYRNPAGARPSVHIERKLGSLRYADEEIGFDYFGRVRRELQSIPTGLASHGDSERLTLYDAAGRITAVTTVQQAGQVNSVQKTTRYFDYDPFGRPARILRPDGTEELRSYLGECQVSSTVAVRTSQSGSSDVTTTTTLDALGRTVKGREP